MTAGLAWFRSDRQTFLNAALEAVVNQLAGAASEVGLHIEPEQNQEWRSSVGLLQEQLKDRVELLRSALASPELAAYRDIVLEYDFRRRGLRLDCVLLGDGIIAVVEFKRSVLAAADRDQVTNYCVNLVEFHEETRRACEQDACVVAPVLCLTAGERAATGEVPTAFHNAPWTSILRRPLECDAGSLKTALLSALGARRAFKRVEPDPWIEAKFSPSSSILDAAISLYGSHDVSAISQHAAPVELIANCTQEVAALIAESQSRQENRIVFVSGAPGAGKTLVGLNLAFDSRFRKDAVFVTGNAPLVEVLTEALKNSYVTGRRQKAALVRSGYSKEDVHQVIQMATFKIVKAHNFLGERGRELGARDGKVLIFDEAQRTYAEGREVLRRRLEADEAEMILRSLEESFPEKGAVVVALLGHNQAINRGELGVAAWFAAAEKLGWRYAIANQTLDLLKDAPERWAQSPMRDSMQHGHLPHSLRYYRNQHIETWAGHVLDDKPAAAAALAANLDACDTIWLTRDLAKAREWARARRVGEERAGVIASGQARRLAAEGLFVDLKPSIAPWVLAPSGDIRSSNMLGTVQNQSQIQGLEIDYSIVCWDGDLRRSAGRWKAFKISGAKWQSDKELDVAKNGYRVLLTRARKGMVLFVPRGDLSGEDQTRDRALYDDIAQYLLDAGAKSL